jgi:hypothetical protein
VGEPVPQPRAERRAGRIAAFSLGVLLAGCGGDGTPEPTTAAVAPAAITCPLQNGSGTLPSGTRRGLIQHLQRYPVLGLATQGERARARRLLTTIEAAADSGRWRDPAVAARRGFVRRTKPRKAGDETVHYLHAELGRQRRTGRFLDPARPKALIYANAPARRLVLVGAMYSLKRGERGPSPGGPITRWHSHLVCTVGSDRGVKPRDDGSCGLGARLVQGSEMLHVWFTSELRSAFAISAPEPELCRAGLLPAGYCRTVDGKRRGM